MADEITIVNDGHDNDEEINVHVQVAIEDTIEFLPSDDSNFHFRKDNLTWMNKISSLSTVNDVWHKETIIAQGTIQIQ